MTCGKAKRRAGQPQLVALAESLDVPERCGCPKAGGLACMAGRAGFPGACPGPDACGECPPSLGGSLCRHFYAADAAVERLLNPDGDEGDGDFARFAKVLAAADRRPPGHPDGLRDGPPPAPTVVGSRKDRINLYRLRARAGEQLFHPDEHKYGRLLESVCVDAEAGRGPLSRGAAAGVRRDVSRAGAAGPGGGVEWTGYRWKEREATDEASRDECDECDDNV